MRRHGEAVNWWLDVAGQRVCQEGVSADKEIAPHTRGQRGLGHGLGGQGFHETPYRVLGCFARNSP